MFQRAVSWFDEMDRRRSIRRFSTEPVPPALLAHAIATASTAPPKPTPAMIAASPSSMGSPQ